MAIEEYTGPEKSAILLLSLGEDIAAAILKYMEEPEIQKLSNYMSQVDAVSGDTVNRITQEFYQKALEGGGLTRGGGEYLRKVLSLALDPEKVDWILENISVPSEETGLETIKWLDPKTIASFTRGEHPQTIAIILAHLESQQATAVLGELPEILRSEVALRIATLERIPSGVLKDLGEVLQKELQATGTVETVRKSTIGGVEVVAEMLNQMDQSMEHGILSKIEETHPDLAEQIRQLMFVFEDLIHVDDRGMQQIMKEVSTDNLVPALKTASEGLREKIFRNMSERAAMMLKEDLEALGPVRLADVEKAQQAIVRVAKKLEDEGKILIGKRGGEDVFV
ncbi:MAG TPA: flagellar motor switch protein FliG [bacterium]|nr:flagellar motor switch protein FliG [bacterium]